MTKTLRTIVATVAVTIVVLAAMAAVAYTFRDRLAKALTLEDVDPASADLGMTGRMPEPAPNITEPAAQGSPRAEVRIDPRRQQLIGVRIVPAERRALTKAIRAVGTVRYDETRLADVNVKVAGWIETLNVDYTGQFIEAGQPLFTLYSPDLLTTQQEYVLARDSRDQLRDSQIPDARVYADRLVDAARQRLVLWDVPPEEIQALEEGREPRRTMLFRTPVGGFVIEKTGGARTVCVARDESLHSRGPVSGLGRGGSLRGGVAAHQGRRSSNGHRGRLPGGTLPGPA